MTVEARGVLGLLRPDVWGLKEYAAPEPLEEFAARQGLAVADIVKLDQNENPYGCSPRVQEALARCQRLHVYPDPSGRQARRALERYVGVGQERIAVGNGSDELIEVLFRLFLQPGDRVLSFTPTFAYYPTVAGTCAAEFVGIPRRDDWTVDVEAGLAAVDDRTKIVVVASPNNPTGTLTPVDDIRRLLSTSRLVIVDEAYFEFADRTALSLVEDHDNLVVLRTLSKWAGLAGIRIGYGVFPEWLLPHLYKLKPPYGVSVAATVALIASLEDVEYLRHTVRLIVAERERLARRLGETGFLRPYPSAANFVLAEVLRGDPTDVRRRLEDQGILIRAYSDPRLARTLRFSVGRPDQTDRLVEALKRIGESK